MSALRQRLAGLEGIEFLDRKLFRDGSHMNGDGAEVFSALLVEELANRSILTRKNDVDATVAPAVVR